MELDVTWNGADGSELAGRRWGMLVCIISNSRYHQYGEEKVLKSQ